MDGKKNMPPWRIILFAGLITGSLDAIAAIIQFLVSGGSDPGRIFQYIASGLIGPKAFSGQAEIIVLGVGLHFFIAWVFAAFYFIVYPYVFKNWNVFAAGLVYGLFVWSVMNLVVVPLSLARQGPFVLQKALIAMMILVLAIGIPNGLVAGKYYLYRK